ncbi:MAG: hypothetical protein JST85_22935 [Acidobacteria bacterium]|nr:hypothetical protein [Acidobacteriota bacterium]
MPKQRTGYVYFDEKRNAWTARVTYKDEFGKVRNRRRQVANKTEGKTVLRQLLRELDDHGGDVLDGDRLTFKELATVYEEKRLFKPTITPSGKAVGLKTYQSVRRRLRTLVAHFGARRIRAITHADIEAFKRTRLATLPARLTAKRKKLENRIEELKSKRRRKDVDRDAQIAECKAQLESLAN